MEYRKIQEKDNPQVAQIIRQVMTEFGAVGTGFSIEDPEVDFMHQSYQSLGHAYFVCTENEKILGGSGIGPLLGGSPDTCELKKMYISSEARGKGLGQKLMELCLMSAREYGFSRCYIETLSGMDKAMKLYESYGFKSVPSCLGKTGHGGCDHYYLLDLN